MIGRTAWPPRPMRTPFVAGRPPERVRRDDVIAFCQQLSVMLDTGVPLAEALDSFRKQNRRSADFQHVLAAIANDVSGGETLSAAMERWPTQSSRASS
jgi:type II secretory pathway component PulF